MRGRGGRGARAARRGAARARLRQARSRSAASRASARPASASSSATRTARAAPPSCSRTPTRRSTAPRSAAAAATRSSTSACATASTARLRIEADLRRAIEAGDQLWVAYQPFYGCPAGRSRASRRCCAGTTPSAAPIPPVGVHPRRRGLGLIVELGELVLRTACRQVARWQARRPAARAAPDASTSPPARWRSTGMPGDGRRRPARDRPRRRPRSALEITEGAAARGDAGDRRDAAGAAARSACA